MLNVYIYSPPHPFDGTARNNKEKESNGHDDAAVAQKNMDRHMAVNPNVKEKGHGTLDQPASDMSSTARAAEEHLDKFMLSVTDADILLTAQKDQKDLDAGRHPFRSDLNAGKGAGKATKGNQGW